MRSVLGGIADAFEDRNFRAYSLGSVLSWLSYYVQTVAVAWTAWELTHSMRWLAIVGLLDAVPYIVLTPLGGVLADRTDRLRLLLLTYALATLHAAVLAVLAFAGALTIGWLAALAVAHGTVHAFSVPAAFGLLPRFIAQARLSSAIAVSAAYSQLGIFLGPAVAGWLIAQFGTATAYAANVVGYGIFLACVAAMRTPPEYAQPPASGKAMRHDLLDGLRAITAHRGILGILALMFCGNALWAALHQMAPALADTTLGAGIEGLSTLLACAGIGATLAALWLAHGGVRRATPDTILVAFIGFVMAVAALLCTRSLFAAALAMGVASAWFEICDTGTVALLQNAVPDALRGRVMSTQFMLVQLAGSSGVAIIGVLASAWGLQVPMLGLAALAGLVWFAVFRSRARISAAFGTHARERDA